MAVDPSFEKLSPEGRSRLLLEGHVGSREVPQLSVGIA